MKKYLIILIISTLSFTVNAECSDFISVKEDSFTKEVTLSSETCDDKSNILDVSGYTLISTGKNLYSILLISSYFDRSWRNYYNAVDSSGKKYEPTFPIRRKVLNCSGNKCSYIEQMITVLTRKDMESIVKNGGLDMRFNAENSSQNKIIPISASLVRSMIEKNDEVFPTNKSNQKK